MTGQMAATALAPHGASLLWVRESTTDDGKKVYFAMERMDEKWENYTSMVGMLLMGGNKCLGGRFGSLFDIHDEIKRKKDPRLFLTTCVVKKDVWTGDEQCFQWLCDTLAQADLSMNAPKSEALHSLQNALSGINTRSQTHIVYACKSPITKPFFPRPEQTHKGVFGGFCDDYDDLLMCVGSTIQETLVENRGIFRNPLSIISGGFSGLAIALHQFTCECVLKHYPAVTTFRVRPLQHMARILFAALPQEAYTINGDVASEYDGTFRSEEDFRIPVKTFLMLRPTGKKQE